jgi:hypothetical protein
MSLQSDLFAKLAPLVGNRCYPLTFPESVSPIWPAIRYTVVDVTPIEDLEGDGTDDESDARVQIDAVTTSYVACMTLRANVMAAMKSFVPPARLDQTTEEYDVETKTHRAMLQYVVYGSSDRLFESPP